MVFICNVHKKYMVMQADSPYWRVIVSVSPDWYTDIKTYLSHWWPICREFQTLTLVKPAVMLVSYVPDTFHAENAPKKINKKHTHIIIN